MNGEGIKESPASEEVSDQVVLLLIIKFHLRFTVDFAIRFLALIS